MVDEYDKFELQGDYEPEDVTGHIEQVAPLIMDAEGWPVQPPGLPTPTGGQHTAQSAQAAHTSAQFSAQAHPRTYAPAHAFASEFPHVTTSSTLICG